MLITLDKKIVLITGASRGIGKALALELAKEGALIIINYNRNERSALELLDEIRTYNENCMAVKADVTNAQDVKNMYRYILGIYGRVDFLINNAGKCVDSLLPMMREVDWDDVVDTNLKGCFLCCREFSKAMIKQRCGKIVNISSLKGIDGCAGQVNYSASKAGIIGLTKAMAKELGQYNISVNAICPGFIVTDLNRHNKDKKQIAEQRSVLSVEYALNDLINFIKLLLSDSINGISGQVFNLDSRLK